MKNFIKGFLATFILFGSLFVTTFAVAANPLGAASQKLDRALGTTGLERNLDTSIGTVVKGILALVGTIFLCLTIYAGILWMTAQGNSEKVDKAKGIVSGAVIGLFITMAAYAITAFVADRVSGVGSQQSSAPNGCCFSTTPAAGTLNDYGCVENVTSEACNMDGYNWMQGPCPQQCNQPIQLQT